MSDAPRHAHSLSEAYLFLRVHRCPLCAQGALAAGEGRRLDDADGAARIEIQATCQACGKDQTFGFTLRDARSLVREGQPTSFNPSDDPSRLIDLAQWLTLFRMMLEEAAKEEEKSASRAKSIEAAMCLEEALKFYHDPDNDLPPNEAFFDEASRKRRRDHPEQFSRRRLVEMRAKLPSPTPHGAPVTKRRRWWRPW